MDFMLGFLCIVFYKVDVLILRDTWCGKIHLCHVVAPSSMNMFLISFYKLCFGCSYLLV